MLKSLALLSISTTLIFAAAAQADTVKIGGTEYLSTLPGAEAYVPAKRQPRYEAPAPVPHYAAPARVSEPRQPRYEEPAYVAPPVETQSAPYQSPLLAEVRAQEHHHSVTRHARHSQQPVAAKTGKRHHSSARHTAKKKSHQSADNASSSQDDLLNQVRTKIRHNQ